AFLLLRRLRPSYAWVESTEETQLSLLLLLDLQRLPRSEQPHRLQDQPGQCRRRGGGGGPLLGGDGAEDEGATGVRERRRPDEPHVALSWHDGESTVLRAAADGGVRPSAPAA